MRSITKQVGEWLAAPGAVHTANDRRPRTQPLEAVVDSGSNART